MSSQTIMVSAHQEGVSCNCDKLLPISGVLSSIVKRERIRTDAANIVQSSHHRLRLTNIRLYIRSHTIQTERTVSTAMAAM